MPNLQILPLQYNSACITFSEWISLFTLCLAPLIAHILAGTPQTSHLSPRRPKWHDSICHYNPTSIIWRYAAITDRRIRARRWSRADLAASNAIFWTQTGWNGDEAMVDIAAPHCLRYPEHTHVKILSATALKTLVTMLQGLSAAYSLVGALAGVASVTFQALMGLDMVFFPLAVLGLLRLCPAVWLAEDFEYALRGTGAPDAHAMSAVCDAQQESLEGVHDPFLMVPLEHGARFEAPGSSWASWGFRVVYLSVVAGADALAIVYSVPLWGESIASTTSFLVGVFYIFLFTVSVVLYAYYFLRSQTTSTLIPCLSSMWYKVYTFLLLSFMLVIVVIASIETTRAPDGHYLSIEQNIKLNCADRRNWWGLAPDHPVSGFLSRENSTIGSYSGVELKQTLSSGSRGEEEYWLYDFTGFCVGRMTNASIS